MCAVTVQVITTCFVQNQHHSRFTAYAMPLLSSAGLAVTAGFRQSSQNARMNAQLSIKDLPEHGLSLIGSSNSLYDSLVSALFPGRKFVLLQTLRPYSVVLRNTSNRTVIACRLKWEFTGDDGRVKVEPRGFITFGPMMGLGVLDTDPNTERNIIKPNSTWLFTPSIIEAQHMNIDGGVEATNAERMQAEYIQTLTARLAQYASITVSLDGVFFDDGTFVGPDTTQFFAYVEALQSARQDMFREVKRGLMQGKTATEMLDQVAKAAKGSEVRLSSAATSSDFYNFHRNIVSKEILKMRERSGDDRASKFSVEELDKSWLKLRKK